MPKQYLPLPTWLSRFIPAGWLERPPINFGGDEWYDGTGGPGISKDKALAISAIWRGVSLISGYVGKIPLFVYRRTDQGKERAPTDPAFRLCRHRAHPFISALAFRETLTGHALLQGGGFAFIVREKNPRSLYAGRPLELIPLSPSDTYPKREKGVLWYITHIDGKPYKIEWSNVLHIHGFGFDGTSGYSLVKHGATSLGLARGAQEHGRNFFEHGTALSGVLEHPAVMSPEAIDKLRRQWAELYQGVAKHHKPAILEEGMKWSTLGLSAEDSQLIESMRFSFVDVANWLGCPPHKLGDSNRTSYNSLEQENQAFLDDCLDHWLCVWEEECWEKLLSERQKERDTHFVEFERKAIIRADLKTRALYYKIALGNRPWMIPDEVRDLENTNLLGGEAAEFKDPSNNFSPAGGAQQPTEGTQANADKLLDQAIARMVQRIARALDRCKSDAARGRICAEALDEHSPHGRVVNDALQPAAALVEELSGREAVLSWALAQVIERAKTYEG